MKKFLLFLSTPLALLPAMQAHAQSADDDDVIVVATGVAQLASEAGRSVTVLDRETIETRQKVSLSDLLATTTGVGVTRNGGPGAVTAVRIRGAEDAQTLVLIDGVRVNDPSSPGGAYDFGNLLTGPVERVEVLRGPNSVAWGSQAIGGVVNVVTETPTDGFHARANAEYGYADQVSTNATIMGGSSDIQGALTGGYFRTDGISQAASGTEADGYRQYGASGRLKARITPNLRAELRGYWADSKLELDGFPAPTYAFADTEEYSTAQELYGYAGLTGDFGPTTHRIGFSIADINRDNYDPTVSAAPLYLYRGRSEHYSYQGQIGAPMARLVIGADQDNQRFYDGAATFSANITSVYGEAIVTPMMGLAITAGVRNDDHSGFGGHVTWGANVAYSPMPGTRLHASYGEGFKAPTLYQLYAPYYGTATLEPETADSWEVGARQDLVDGKLSLGATWFQRDTTNQIDFDSVTYTYANIARTRAEGVELEVEIRPNDRLTFTGNYTYTDAENRSAGYVGNDLARRPKDIASVSADWESPFGLKLGGTVSIVGDSYDNAANTTRLDGYALASIRAEMPLTDRIAIYGRVENLTDEDYEVVSGYSTYGRAAYAGVRLRLD
ncbi:TonB-dependent receptor plug domain-containing protein [Stakelama tenebrarum]|uniref:TonB-dependent receptor n=1 Tax=Stakelama tenebrarum TaxID=2711215 RepID=A0A6G6Y8S5_9SPHN|nr:TonB-dependent receptor [Sphingosinithalassobacter tenebrarum]QIG81319.1 TonB-dependent receptor [Sphingosinithalassobacter tenebrarum]